MRKFLNSAPFRRPTSVVRNRSHIADNRNFQSCGLQRPNCRFTSRTGTFHEHFYFSKPQIVSFLGCGFCRDLRCKGCILPGALEGVLSGGRPRDGIAVGVGDGNNDIVECRLHVHFSVYVNVNFLFLFCRYCRRCLMFCHDLPFRILITS